MRSFVRLLFVALLLAVSAALARADVFSGFDVMSATVMQQHQSSFSGLGMRARLKSSRLVDGIDFLPYIEYWRNSTTVEPFNITTTRKDATLGADVRVTIPRKGWKPYLGAGLGLHFLSSEVNAPTLGLHDASDSVIKGGLSGLGGVSFPISEHFDNFIEVKYHHLPGFSQLKINWGLAWGR